MSPITYPDDSAYGFSAAHGIHDCSPGLTKRELFAAMAMQGLVPGCGPGYDYPAIAEHATRYADALIAALSKEQKP